MILKSIAKKLTINFHEITINNSCVRVGQRFKDAGYSIPKFLIGQRKEIINHVVNMFEEVENIIFICNENNLKDKNLNLKSVLQNLHPKTKIIPIQNHKKGPIHAVLESEKFIDLSMPTGVNYCDFNSLFNFSKFRRIIEKKDLDGCVFTYTGFHPHMLGNTNYAYIKKLKILLSISKRKIFY